MRALTRSTCFERVVLTRLDSFVRTKMKRTISLSRKGAADHGIAVVFVVIDEPWDGAILTPLKPGVTGSL
eukprot:scaffold175158_cov63-Attheya_sp.AAC.1